MTGKEAIKNALKGTQNMLNMYVSDLSDADLLVRPVPGANHIAWQLGHLITAEGGLLADCLPGAAYQPLPAGFREKYTKETASSDAPAGFLKKGDYLATFNQAREATLAALDKLSDADLDRPTTGKMAQFAPTVGALLLLVSNHTLMHAGQFTPVRRTPG